MLDQSLMGMQHAPSDYWRAELAGFDYLLDASPLIVEKLREHCYHLTGLRSYEYRSHHAHVKKRFEGKLNALRALDRHGLFVPESREMGGFGHEIDGSLVNVDTLKFYESLTAMDQAGLLDRPRRDTRMIVLEIGAGWGGFAYQFKTLFPKVCYVLVDLPQTLLVSSVYLKTVFPNAKCLMYGEPSFDSAWNALRTYDIVFLPHYALPHLSIQGIELGVNMVSFQEMTVAQVVGYLDWLIRMRCPAIYSLNRDRSKHNAQMSSVSTLLQRYFEIQELRPLPVPYTTLSLPKNPVFKWPKKPGVRSVIREWMQYYLKATEGRSITETDYRHFVGRPKGAPGLPSPAPNWT
jgi:putative sugar O-methyltransferase